MDSPRQRTRREVLTGRGSGSDPLHISSAVVFARPDHVDAVCRRLSREAGVEVHGRRGPKIVIVMEAPTAGRLGEMLNRITLMDGVVSAAMVFEQFDGPGEAS